MDYIVYNLKTGEHVKTFKIFEEGLEMITAHNRKTNRVGDLAIDNEDDLEWNAEKNTYHKVI